VVGGVVVVVVGGTVVLVVAGGAVVVVAGWVVVGADVGAVVVSRTVVSAAVERVAVVVGTFVVTAVVGGAPVTRGTGAARSAVSVSVPSLLLEHVESNPATSAASIGNPMAQRDPCLLSAKVNGSVTVRQRTTVRRSVRPGGLGAASVCPLVAATASAASVYSQTMPSSSRSS